MSTIKIGISACLLGTKVRFDGGHKKDSFLTGTLSDYFEWVPVCPEVEVGMSTPRESLRLVGDAESPRMVTTKTGMDWTDRMNQYVHSRIADLKNKDLSGYILKSKSPSCGMERVRVYSDKGIPTKNGQGLFAKVLADAMPALPMEEEGRLHDPRIRENFITRVFCYYRWQTLAKAGRVTMRDLTEFHARHKFLIMAHSEKHMREMGRLLAKTKDHTPSEMSQAYGALFFEALARKTTVRRHVNVLEHIAGFFKKEISTDDRSELQQAIEDYHKGLLPLIVPITLLRHHTRNLKVSYIRDQIYLHPHPKEMMLLNHV